MTEVKKPSTSRAPKNGISTVVSQATGAPVPEVAHFHIAPVLVARLGAAIVAYEDAKTGFSNVCDDLLRAGVTCEVVKGSDKGDSFCREVLLSFELPENQALVKSKPTTLEGRQKKEEINKRLRRRLSDVLRFLDAAEKLESLSVDQREEKSKLELSQWVVDQINTIEKRINKAPAASFSVVEVLDALKSLRVLVQRRI